MALAHPEYLRDAESPVSAADRLRGVTGRIGRFDYDAPERDQPRPRQPDDHLGSL